MHTVGLASKCIAAAVSANSEKANRVLPSRAGLKENAIMKRASIIGHPSIVAPNRDLPPEVCTDGLGRAEPGCAGRRRKAGVLAG